MSPTPPRGGLNRLLQELSPGARLVGMRRLRGGLGARMHVLRIESAEGERRSIVLRRYRPGPNVTADQTQQAANEFQVLSALQKEGVPAAEPLLLDAAGHYLGVPTVVLSYLEGRSLFEPRDPVDWCHQLAEAILAVHAISPSRYNLFRLPRYELERTTASIARRRTETQDGEPLAREVTLALETALPDIEWLPPVLIHEDFWPGNTVWRRGRLVGIVDWTSASVGDPRFDVAQCRADLVVSQSVELADAFLAAYEEARGGPLHQMRFFDLMRGLLALLNYKNWLRGYADAGLRQDPDEVGERLRAFLRRTLASA